MSHAIISISQSLPRITSEKRMA